MKYLEKEMEKKILQEQPVKGTATPASESEEVGAEKQAKSEQARP